MKPLILFLFLLINFTMIFAQQPAWELVRSDFWGEIAIDPINPDIIYVSPHTPPAFGLYKSTDGGKTWVQYLTGYEGLGSVGIVIDPKNPQQLWLYGGEFTGIVRSENGGMTAVRADTGIYYDHHGYSVSAFAYDSKRRILYAGDLSAGGIYRSFSRGRRWQLVYGYDFGLRFNPIFFFVEQDSGWIYSGTAGHGLWRSKDLGVTWAPLDPKVLGGQPLGEPISFIAKVPNSHTLYATSKNGRVFKSYDLGENWNLASDATTDSSELSGGLLVSSLDTNYVFVGARGQFSAFYGGFIMSKNGGKSWMRYHSGFPQYDLRQYQVWAMTQPTDSRYILASMHFLIRDVSNADRYRIYKLSQIELLTSVKDNTSVSVTASYVLKPNYPNPFNAQTKIEFTVPQKDLIAIDVYNLNGKHVANLFNGQTNAGNHSVFWNGKNSKGGDSASGIYLYRLKAGKQFLIRKMLLIR